MVTHRALLLSGGRLSRPVQRTIRLSTSIRSPKYGCRLDLCHGSSTRRPLHTLGRLLNAVTESSEKMAAQSSWGDTGQSMARLETVDEDENWTQLLPEGSSIVAAKGGPASYWSQTAWVTVRLLDETEKRYFLKLTKTDLGRAMVYSEFESMEWLYRVAPNMVPRPIGRGTCKIDSNTHFFLCEYVDLHDGLPDKNRFCRDLATLHQDSMRLYQGNDQTRRFGFERTTYNGRVKQNTDWTASWEEFFTRMLREGFVEEQETHGVCEEFTTMLPVLYDKVCPRLLRPLETGGNSLTPCLVHGDLWDGNVALSAKGQPYIFDAASFWAHNEYELHMWRGERYKFRDEFREEYFKHIAPSAPEEDCDGRNLLYSLMADLHDSILFPNTSQFRKLLIHTLKELLERYAM